MKSNDFPSHTWHDKYISKTFCGDFTCTMVGLTHYGSIRNGHYDYKPRVNRIWVNLEIVYTVVTHKKYFVNCVSSMLHHYLFNRPTPPRRRLSGSQQIQLGLVPFWQQLVYLAVVYSKFPV